MRSYHFGFALIAVAILAGCSSPPPSPSKDDPSTALDAMASDPTINPATEIVPIEQRDIGDHMIISLDAEPGVLNTVLDSADATSRFICSFIYDTLLEIDRDTLGMKGRLAYEWETSDDHLTYTFKMHENAQFSDGVPVTAEDVKFSWELLMNPENDTAALRNYMQDIESVNAIDDHTVQFRMKKPYFRHIISLGTEIQILPKHIYGKGPLQNHPANRAPVGSGPYKFERWDTGQQIVLTRNENYWGPRQPIEKFIWKIITDDNAAFQALQRGDTDMYRVKPDDWLRKGSTPEFNAKFNRFTPGSPIPGFVSRLNYIGWNMRKPQFSDKRVRQALCMLFDRQLVIDQVWGGLGTLVTGDIYHLAPEYNKDVQPWPFDPEGAGKLLDEAGWIDTDQDGIRDKNGIKLQFELSFTSGVQEYERLSTVYQEELKRAGINVVLDPLEWATFQERVQERTFDACMLAWLLDVGPDPYQLFHSSQSEKGSNHPGLENDEVDQILDDARLEFDQEKRNTMYHRYHEILHDEQPYLFLYARPGLIAIDKRFHGVVNKKGGFVVTDWWVPKDQQKYPSTTSN
ncbi:MAG: peptide-binding protein [Candidatus Hydrogenedentota bacterium]